MILVTGGSGYFGMLLVQNLLRQGQRVRILDLNAPDDLPAEGADKVEFQKADIRDPAGVRQACEGAETVFHCVAQVPLARDKQLLWSVNCDGTRNLLEAAQAEQVGKVVYISSSAVFGVPAEAPITPETQPKPAEEYGAAKYEGEKLCQQFIERGLDVSIIRPRTIMGHGRLGIMQLLFEWVCQGTNVFVLGKGDNKYQFVHADDLAEASIKASERSGPSVYNIGAATFGTMRETLEGLVKHAGTRSRVRSLPYGLTVLGMRATSALRLSPLASYHHLVYGKNVYFDISKPQRELAWQPKWGNIEMFCQSYDWYVKHRDEILKAKGRSTHRSAVKQGILKVLQWI